MKQDKNRDSMDEENIDNNTDNTNNTNDNDNKKESNPLPTTKLDGFTITDDYDDIIFNEEDLDEVLVNIEDHQGLLKKLSLDDHPSTRL